MKITSKFSILEMVCVPNFILNRQFCFLDQIWPKRVEKKYECEILCWLLHKILVCFTHNHCVKSVCIRSFSGPHSIRMRENTIQKNLEYRHFSRSEYIIGILRLRRNREVFEYVCLRNNSLVKFLLSGL